MSWWDVHEHVTPYFERVGSWPMLGTPAWCALADDDARKIAALSDAAQHWALHVETSQQAKYDASQVVSESQTWCDIAQEIQRRRDVCIPTKAAP